MKRKQTVAEQDRGFLAPRFSPSFARLATLIGGAYLRLAQGVRSVETRNMESLYQAMLRSQSCESRLLVVFRHVALADGPVMISTISRELRHWCRATNRRLPSDPYAHFLYGKGTLNWAGALARFAFPRMGGVPVVNGIVDRSSQSAIRSIVTNGEFPLALAPEGQITYHQFRSFSLAPGIGALSRWAQDSADGRRVEILPVVLGYSYGSRLERVIVEAVRRICNALDQPRAIPGTIDHTCLIRLTGDILGRLEKEFPFVPSRDGQNIELTLQDRIDRACRHALECGERMTGLSGGDNILARVFRLRYWIMQSRYREGRRLAGLDPLERGLAESRARAAEAIDHYERLADLLEYIRVDYISPGTAPRSRHRLAEYALNLLDLINRATGGEITTRWEPGGRTALVSIGHALNATAVYARATGKRNGSESISKWVAGQFDSMCEALEERQG